MYLESETLEDDILCMKIGKEMTYFFNLVNCPLIVGHCREERWVVENLDETARMIATETSIKGNIGWLL